MRSSHPPAQTRGADRTARGTVDERLIAMDTATHGTPGTGRTLRATAHLLPVVGLATVLALSGCGEGGSGDLPSRTGSGLPSVSLSVPSVTRAPSTDAAPSESEAPTETDAPTEEPSTTPTEEPTEPASTTPAPTRTKTSVVTETATTTAEATETPTPTPSASPSPSTSALGPTTDDADTGIPAWVWWLLAAAVVAGLVAAILVPRSRRRAEWEADLASTDSEVTWFARELLPQLQLAGTADALAGGWRVAALRVTALEDRLTRLETVAPDEASGARARQLRDAVRAARGGVEDLVASRDTTSAAARLGSVAAQLEASLQPPVAGTPDPR